MRFTPSSRGPVSKGDVPLLDRHIGRLREAHEHFSKLDSAWGSWVGDEVAWATIRGKLEDSNVGDWRVRVVLHPGATLEVQVVPAPPTAGMWPSSVVMILTLRSFQASA